MHLPDGFLNNQASISLIVISLAVGSYALKKVKLSLFEKTKELVPKLMTNVGVEIDSQQVVNRLRWKNQANKKIQQIALVAAFIFAAQMINFPITNGTSGHLIGGVLAAVVLGPWAGMLVMTIVLITQALVFADGGIIVLGANVFNMGIIAGIGGYYLYIFSRELFKNKYLALVLASWLSVILAAVFCSLELAVSKTISLSLALPAMVSIHALIGIGEALITILALKFLFNESEK